ncbi:MAG TPA: Gfo/Idh/MocA family oxidoreductase [Clostridiales bacterium]|nr:Gfo/Idh/MocA family oxidoreductase [Clostridiales bacterium]
MNESSQNKVRLGFIGLSGRGKSLLGTVLAMEDVEIPAVCEVYDDRLQTGIEQVEAAGRKRPEGYKDYRKLLERDDIEGVVIATSWTTHLEIALAAMEAGKYVGTEVGGASSLEECWELVRTSEKTGMPCMMLENCCYGRNEMTVLNMVKKNLLGELIHCQCGYEHDLRQEVACGIENRHYRIHNYLNRNGDVYPTHGLGPVAKCLNINRGNRFINLTSMSSKSRGINEWVKANKGEDHPFAKTNFALGDVVTTMIKCAHGETILIIHDTSLPRPYSRAGRVQGTKGIWMEDNNSIYIEGRSPEHTWESFEDYRNEYEHPLWKEYLDLGVRGGHGGMDYLVLRAFVESVKNKVPTPIDVYDTAAWMAVTALSEQSITMGSSPVGFPDFTNGKWIGRKSGPESKYSLENIYEDLF